MKLNFATAHRTFSLAVRLKEMDEPRWIDPLRLEQSRLFQRVDWVRLTRCSFQLSTYEKEGETPAPPAARRQGATVERQEPDE